MKGFDGLTIVALSEDSGRDGRLTVKRVIKRLLVEWLGTRQALHVDDSSDTPEAAHANRWRSRSPRDRRACVDFIKRLATDLREGKVVVFHYDGDAPWEQHGDALSRSQFESIVSLRLKQLEDMKEKPINQDHLLEMVPHYHIESWVYQATDRAIQISQEQHGSTDVELYQKWAAERALLDEVPKPGPKEMTRLRDKHNAELAQHIPSVEVIAVNKSFAAFARKLYGVVALESLRRPEIVAALQSDGP